MFDGKIKINDIQKQGEQQWLWSLTQVIEKGKENNRKPHKTWNGNHKVFCFMNCLLEKRPY